MDDDATGLATARRILDLARGVLADLDLEVVLQRVLEAARELSGARYAALGLLDQPGTGLARFLTSGIEREKHREIGALPRGEGVLGELISDPRPLRLSDVGGHPRSYGFPTGHPPMDTFLGVPVIIDGRPFGNLYLTCKENADGFTEDDEHALVMLAEVAAIAIDHARRYSQIAAQRTELERTVQALDVTVQIARAVAGETDLSRVLTLVAKRGRALVSARALVIEYEQDGELVIAAGAGDLPPGLIGQRITRDDAVAGTALRLTSTQRLEDGPNRARFANHGLGKLGFRAQAGLVVPLTFRAGTFGALLVVDRLVDGPRFSDEDVHLFEAFAASAATAIATAELAEQDRIATPVADEGSDQAVA